jgi:uncharacterized protein
MAERSGRNHLARRTAASLIIMIRSPVAGRVKRRLARDIGVVRATSFYRNLSRLVATRLAGNRRWAVCAAVTPDRARVWRLPPGVCVINQGSGDIGARMARLLLGAPPGPVVLIGSDIPGVDTRRIVEAYAALRGKEAVFGPAEDGGFWLLGLGRRTLARRMFKGVRWSSEHALADTLKNLAGRPVGLAATLADVDDGASHVRVAAGGVRLLLPPRSAGARRGDFSSK